MSIEMFCSSGLTFLSLNNNLFYKMHQTPKQFPVFVFIIFSLINEGAVPQFLSPRQRWLPAPEWLWHTVCWWPLNAPPAQKERHHLKTFSISLFSYLRTVVSRIRTTRWNMFNNSAEKSSSQFLCPRIGGRSPSSWSLCRCLAGTGRAELNSLRRRWSQDNGNPSRPRGSRPAARQRQTHGWMLHLNCCLLSQN